MMQTCLLTFNMLCTRLCTATNVRGTHLTPSSCKLNPKLSKPNSPGPGAIQSTDWAPIANKHLKNRAVVLHTDGARAYNLKVEGLLHDHNFEWGWERIFRRQLFAEHHS